MREVEIWNHYQCVSNNPDPQSAKRVDFREKNSFAIKAYGKNSPELSIIVPAYNESMRIESTLASINNSLVSSDIPVEVILVDNGSSDQTKEIAQDFGVNVIKEQSKGIGYARQTGLESVRSTSSYILTTDADSVVPQSWIRQHYSALQDSNVVYTYGGIRFLIDEETSKLTNVIFPFYLAARGLFRAAKSRLMAKNYVPATGVNSGFRKEEAMASGGYRKELAALEDYYLAIDLIQSTGGVSQKVKATVLTSA